MEREKDGRVVAFGDRLAISRRHSLVTTKLVVGSRSGRRNEGQPQFRRRAGLGDSS
jgi:hypothetical protein